ncbi:MAG: M20/M25/M40 family metallo-hydrolase [Clostridia bacterium]|nr:M20/M25/M40 family metallo-hydrolase [Clostridia bacterium]MBN2882368.1 M20/M25/M40 family metallo-hydrolase [Clostridia bacterium]
MILKNKKMFIVLSILIAVLTACSANSTNDDNVYLTSNERMIDIISTISAEDGGRIAGFAGEAKTAEYIKGKFKDIGLEVSTQSFPVMAFACDNAELRIISGSDDLAYGVKVLTFSAPTADDGVSAEIIPIGLGAVDDYTGLDVSGKIVLIMRGGEYFRIKVERAYEKGALAAVFYDPNGDEAVSATLTQLSSIPALSISRSDAVAIEKAVADGVTVSVHLTVDSITRDSTSSNVIGIYKSKDNPDNRCVIVSAHYDGVDTPAANDNASGVAVMLEIAHTLISEKITLPYDVRFIAFGAEEIGLVGSTAYVNSLKNRELRELVAVLNYDMVGIGDSFEILTVEGTENSELVEAIEVKLGQMGYVPIISNTDRSDHASFSYAGVQAVDIQMSPAEYYHTDMDTLDKIQPDNLKAMVELGIGLLRDGLPGLVD